MPSLTLVWKRLFAGSNALGIASAGKWLGLFILIGLVAGLGAILFQALCQLGMHFFLDSIAGYRPPVPAGEPHILTPTTTPLNRWILVILPAAGGILSGWLVYTFAPEAEGHGTDAAIQSFHAKKGFIRGRVPILTTVASAITLTTGGSGGREGPIAQIGAGFGSFLATKLKLSDRQRRIMLAAGMAAGIGSIFRAPLASALFAAEVMYKDPEFESDVLIPAGIASVVAYCLFCLVFGWGSLFQAPDYTFQNPMELLPYTALALVLSAGGFIFVKVFYSVHNVFAKISIPNHLKPAVGGLATGMIGYFLPETLAFGYGYVQQALYDQLPLFLLLAIAGGKILTTSFSIGSGGSGGVFGPSVVIGGALGGAVGTFFHNLFPKTIAFPGSFVIVGMAGFFTSVSNAPVSTIIFISEMTNSYHLLLPSLLVCFLCYLLSKPWTIYLEQVKNKVQSPAHMGTFFVDILQAIKVEDLMDKVKKVLVVPEEMKFSEFKTIFCSTSQHYFPVMDNANRLAGIFSSTDFREILFTPEVEDLIVVKDIAISDIITTHPKEDLNTLLEKFTAKNIDEIPVVDTENPDQLLGMLSRREAIALYNLRVQEVKSGKA